MRTLRRLRLNEVLESSGVAVEAWLDPSQAADMLQAFYRNEGFLSVTVTAGAPTVVGDAGVLPIRIDEGSQFVVSNVTYPGVSPERVATSASRGSRASRPARSPPSGRCAISRIP